MSERSQYTVDVFWQVNLQTAAQHAELMRKVETLNLLQDSNHLLRDERNRLAERLQDIEAKVSLQSFRCQNVCRFCDVIFVGVKK